MITETSGLEANTTNENPSFLQVEKIVAATKTSDGAGVTLYRSLGNYQLPTLDPFLMLDEFKSDNPNEYMAGFPSHPHRGFETVTYILAGKLEHRDHKGNVGIIESGGIQWMTAGRGIIHSEMPIQENGLMWGFQLWVNLPRNQKMKPPAYQNIEPNQIPEVKLENNTIVRIIAGNSMGQFGAVKGIDTDPLFLDVRLPQNENFIHPIKQTYQSFIYVYQGSIKFGNDNEKQQTEIDRGHFALLSDGDTLSVAATKPETSFIVLSGKPINEPVAKYGPFVMNTEDEIQQAISDFHSGNFTS